MIREEVTTTMVFAVRWERQVVMNALLTSVDWLHVILLLSWGCRRRIADSSSLCLQLPGWLSVCANWDFLLWDTRRKKLQREREREFVRETLGSRQKQSAKCTPHHHLHSDHHLHNYYKICNKRIRSLQSVLLPLTQPHTDVKWRELSFLITHVLPSSHQHMVLIYPVRHMSI